MQHKHSVFDTDTHFVVDPVTRAITNVNSKKNTLIQFDHNSEVFDFEIPRFVDGHDMTQCNEVKVHYINIDAKGTETQNKGTYEVKDYGVLESDPDTAVFSWLISDNATQLVGALNFLITFCCTEDGAVLYRWSTGICQTVSISSGMDNGEAVVMEYPDILAQWKSEIFGAQDDAVLAVETAEANALAAIETAGEAKKQSVLESIPDEYEALSTLADSNHRNKASAIVLDAEGESIVLNDASEYPLQNLKVFGKSTQNGTPTPDAPIDIVSVENPAVTVRGKNLLNVDCNFTFTHYVSMDVDIPAGEYILSCNSLSHEYTYGPNILFSNNNVWVEFKDGVLHKTLVLTKRETKLHFYADSADYNWSAGKTATLNGLMLSAFGGSYEAYTTPQPIVIPHTLPGIPVTSGGNYTDENGQQWICDEVDLARGVYVQRVAERTLTGTEHCILNAKATEEGVNVYQYYTESIKPIANAFYCSHFANAGQWMNGLDDLNNIAWHTRSVLMFKTDGVQTLEDFTSFVAAQYAANTPVKVWFAMETPIETPLSEAEITTFKALHSNRPNTTILNDAGAHMAVEYVADTKTYIDNKIKELMEGVTE